MRGTLRDCEPNSAKPQNLRGKKRSISSYSQASADNAARCQKKATTKLVFTPEGIYAHQSFNDQKAAM